jgi:ring-1,2-phenylacetyl-CoA epoxidase subunit PaaE
MEIITFRVEEIRLETAESFTFFLSEVNNKSIAYKAGQFLTLLLHINGREVRRSYSLSSAPTADARLSFTVKRISNGEVSRYLTHNIKPGDLITSLPPSGRFCIEDYDKELYCFVAAGSGIVPVYSLIKSLLSHSPSKKILLISQNRNEQSAIFRKQLRLLQQAFRDRFTVIELYSQPIEHSHQPTRMSNFLFEKLISRHVGTMSVQFYLCGPPLFMKMGEFALRTLGYDASQILKEIFVIDAAPAPTFMIDSEPRKVTIYAKTNSYDFQVNYPQNILQGALDRDIYLPYSCRSGRCSTCTLRLLSGKVKMSMNEILTEKDIAAGLILTCVGYAETDIELEVE